MVYNKILFSAITQRTMAMVHYIWRWLIIMGSGESKKLTMKLTRINKVVSTIPSEGLPKNLTIGSGIARASILNGDYDEESADQVIQPNFPTFRFEFFFIEFLVSCTFTSCGPAWTG